MARPTHTCNRCGQYVALAGLDEIAPGIFECIVLCRRRGNPGDMSAAVYMAHDDNRDAQVAAMRGAPINQDIRTRLNTWRADRQRLKHGGLSW